MKEDLTINNLYLKTNEPLMQPMGHFVMFNIFENLRQYAGEWKIKDSRNFTAEEIACVLRNEIVESQHGNSVCFHIVGGGMTFIPLSINSTKGVGESIDLTKAKLLTLGKAGENDIQRVEE